MTRRAARALLVVLAGSAGYVGAWAALAPRSFFTSFPGAGRVWVAVDGPYDEHLVRDVGALYLALLVVTVTAALRPDPGRVRTVGVAWLMFGVPHFIYHLRHLQLYGVVDQIGTVGTLGGTVLAAAALCLPARQRGPRLSRQRRDAWSTS